MKDVKYSPVIGLEVHVELKTKSKMFCSCKAEYFGQRPNTNTCPVCLGLPGALPVPNKKAIEWCVMIGLALNCKIPLVSKFDRKNYFYPDLPKGYQISQYDEPFAINGNVVIARIRRSLRRNNLKLDEIATLTPFARNDNKKTIRIRRVHMEEDTAKLIHRYGTQNYEGFSLIDFNRSGVPLVEIVTEPDFESATEVLEYLKKLQQVVRYLEVSDADMEKGEMRLEPNISLLNKSLRGSRSKSGDEAISGREGLLRFARNDNSILPNYKVEVKNINSFRFVEKAINYEIERQKKMLEEDKIPLQETRGWDSEKQITVVQRVKEEASDYRYFPEPDIPPINWTKSQIQNIKSQMPELPDRKRKRFVSDYKLSEYDVDLLINAKKKLRNLVETVIKLGRNKGVTEKQVINNLMNKKIIIEEANPEDLLKQIQQSQQVTLIDQAELEKIIKNVLEKNQKAVFDYKKGKSAVIGFLIGKVKQAIKQPLDTKQVKKAIEKHLIIN